MKENPMNSYMKKTLTIVLLTCALSIPAGGVFAEQLPKGIWHGEKSGVKFFPSGKNIAYDKPAATVHPKLTEQGPPA